MRTKLGGELGRLWVYQNIEVGHKFEPVVEKSHEDAHLDEDEDGNPIIVTFWHVWTYRPASYKDIEAFTKDTR